MYTQIQSYDIYNAIAQLEEATNNHNSTFDEANKIFSDVENGLSQINIDYWHPNPLSPRLPAQSTAIPNAMLCYMPLKPFSVVTFLLGYQSKRLVIRKVTSEYDYERDAWGNVKYDPNNFPYAKLLKSDVSDPIPASDSSREIRIMVIENLPFFIEFVRSSISAHTQTLNWALGNIRSS